MPEEVLERATSVIAFARYRGEDLDRHANVVFPAETYPEKEGTVTHPDGRIQRMRQSVGHTGEVRPGWWVLDQLCARAGKGVDALSAPAVTGELAAAVPFYAGIGLDEIGGRGLRWQDRDAASALADAELSEEPLADPPAPPQGLRVVVAPTLWSGGEVEHSRALRFLAADAHAQMSPDDARALGVQHGQEVELPGRGSRRPRGDRRPHRHAAGSGVPHGRVAARRAGGDRARARA